MDRRQRFRLGLIVLLLTPLVVLAAFAVYVYLANAQSQTGELQTRVSPQVVLPWGEAVYYIDYAGFKPTPTPAPTSPTPPPPPTPVPPPPQIEMVFIVDESGSMVATIGAMAAAAQSVVQDLSKERPGRIRYAAIRFDDRAEIQTDWTDSPAQLAQGLGAIAQQPSGGGTDGLVAFNKLDELLATARPKANKVVIFYTDGVMYNFLTAGQIRDAARRLREDQQVDIHSVGLPYVGSDSIMIEVTGSPNKVHDPMNPAELAQVFQEIKGAIAPTPYKPGDPPPPPKPPTESSGQLSHRLDGRHFATPLEDTNWMPGGGSIQLKIQPIPEGPSTYAHPVVPLSAGLWSVGVEPPRLVFADKDGNLHRVEARRRPLLLKVTYFTLLLMLLPALLWALAHVRRRPKREVVVKKELELPPIPPQSLPDPLPLLRRLTLERLAPIPTLFVGLGGGGRRALHAVRADLKQAHLGRAGEPYRFLWIDTDTQEAERESQFEDWEGYKIESLVAPAAVRQTESYLPEPGRGLDHMQWFNAHEYREAPPAQLNLADGAKGKRPLARLALFRWLSAPNGVFPTLVEQFKQLAALPASGEARQIVVFGASDGGVGSGWFLDFGRLFQRIARQQQSQGLEALPEVIGVLCEDPERRHPENRRAVTMELETAMTARKFPQRVTYAPGETLLDQVDAQSPYHRVFSVAAKDKNSVAAQCGELASVLVERHPRAALLDQAQTVPAHVAVATKAFSARVLPTLIYDQVRCEIFLRLLGPDILLDVVADTQGGLRPQTVAADRAGELLDDWSRAEAPGSPLQLLLRAAVDPSAAAGFVNLLQTTSFAPLEWFGQAFSTAVTQRLQGRAVGADAWERGWKPGEAVTTLRLLAARLERNVKPELRTRNAPAQATEVADHVISLANSAAAELERWVQDFCRVCEQVAAQRGRLDQARRQLLRLQDRVYLDLELKPDQVKNWARAGLESWLGTPDTVSAIRKRLFFGVAADGARAQIALHSFIAEPQRFGAAREAAAAIDQLAGALALNVPAARIGGVLAATPDERRRELARELVRIETQPQQVLVILPQTAGLDREERQAVEEFGKAIPKPPAHGPRAQQNGDDHSAVRRIELTEAEAEASAHAGGALPFIEMTESIAEAVRRRAEKKYQIALPIFPPHLRIALGRPDAFRSFARAYKAGHVVLRQDDEGREQWFFVGSGQFLTFGRESSLAHAAANYVRDVPNHPESFATSGSGGSFAKLEQWRDQRVAPDPDTLTQIAVDVYEQ